MLRVYDKAAEQGIDGMKWLRLEFEIKEEQAHAVQGALVVNNDVSGVFRAIWASFIKKCDLIELDQTVGSTSVTIPDVPRKAHSTVAWLLDQVVPAMVSFQDQHPEIDILGLVVNAYTEHNV
jgi:DNA relaxase NicK